jgi:acetyl esterase/lipase
MSYIKRFTVVIGVLIFFTNCNAQNKDIDRNKEAKSMRKMNKSELPENLSIFKDQEYKAINGKRLLLDVYKKKDVVNPPLLVWIHGGAWKRGSKEAFISKNNNLVNAVLDKGYTLASINYRLSSDAIFPAQIQDCNDAINFLYKNADTYGFNKDSIALMGRSAGGHLAALVATSNNSGKSDFISNQNEILFKVKALVDFFGPADLINFKTYSTDKGLGTPEAELLGGSPLTKEALARAASPIYYVDAQTPPTILFHGTADRNVPSNQSELFKSELDKYDIPNELYLVEGARHGDPVFDTEVYVTKTMQFLQHYFPAK